MNVTKANTLRGELVIGDGWKKLAVAVITQAARDVGSTDIVKALDAMVFLQGEGLQYWLQMAGLPEASYANIDWKLLLGPEVKKKARMNYSQTQQSSM